MDKTVDEQAWQDALKFAEKLKAGPEAVGISQEDYDRLAMSAQRFYNKNKYHGKVNNAVPDSDE